MSWFTNGGPARPEPSDKEREDLPTHVDACNNRYWYFDRELRSIKRAIWTVVVLMLVNTGVASQSLGFRSLVKAVFGG